MTLRANCATRQASGAEQPSIGAIPLSITAEQCGLLLHIVQRTQGRPDYRMICLRRVRVRPERIAVRALTRTPEGEVWILTLLSTALAHLETGRADCILAQAMPLSTREAPTIPRICSPLLITLLETGRLPFQMVDSHRRIYLRDVPDHKIWRHQQHRHGSSQYMVRPLQKEADASFRQA